MPKFRIPLFKIYSDSRDIKAVSRVLKSGKDWATGPNVERFESKLAKYTDTRYAVVFNSGTSALHATMIALHIGVGEEVIVPSFTFIATANAVLFVGAKPVFAEIEAETYGLEARDVEARITDKTRAIMPIHYGGCPCHIREIQRIAKKYNLLLIEDAAESLGAMVGQKKIGTFGNIAIISFCAPKIITTGEGGAALTNSRDLYEKLKLIRSHGREEKQNYFSSAENFNYSSLGYNLRMSNITASLGISQLQRIDRFIKMRQKNAKYLNAKLSEIPHIIVPFRPEGYRHIYQMYTIRVRGGVFLRNGLKEHLNQKGIMARVYFPPVHLADFYRKTFGYKKGSFPFTEKISNEVLTLPMYPELSREEMDYIVQEINVFLRGS